MSLSITALLRAHISLIIDNREFQEILIDPSSKEFNDISKPLCNEVRTNIFSLKICDFLFEQFYLFSESHIMQFNKTKAQCFGAL